MPNTVPKEYCDKYHIKCLDCNIKDESCFTNTKLKEDIKSLEDHGDIYKANLLRG